MSYIVFVFRNTTKPKENWNFQLKENDPTSSIQNMITSSHVNTNVSSKPSSTNNKRLIDVTDMAVSTDNKRSIDATNTAVSDNTAPLPKRPKKTPLRYRLDLG